MMPRFLDRRDAGRAIAEQLTPLAHHRHVLVLALPRGGVPVGYELAQALGAPLDVLVVRKLGVPGREELAMGAVASGGVEPPVRVLNRQTIDALAIPASTVARVTRRELAELERRELAYRGGQPPLDVRDKVVVVVDDGLATGATMLAAVAALRRLAPAAVVVAAPVGAAQSCAALRRAAEACVCVVETPRLDGVGSWYVDFSQMSDADVRALLAEARGGLAEPVPVRASDDT
jgi:predicted phosphoribosyltransferase